MAKFRITDDVFGPTGAYKSIFEVQMLATANGALVANSNPLPVSLQGSSSVQAVIYTANGALISNSNPLPVSTQSSTSSVRSVISANSGLVHADVIEQQPGHRTPGLVVRPIMQSAAFGELSIAENYPIFQHAFVYPATHEQLFLINEQATGAVSFANNMVICTAGNTALSLAAITSQRPLKYRAGQGSMTRFTALFGPPAAGSVQTIGLSNGETGLLIGYNALAAPYNTEFGVYRQFGGLREVRTLTVTSGSTGATNATITIEGVPVVVALSNAGAGNPAINAWEISQGAYSTINSVGWDAFVEGATVKFIRKQAGVITSSTFTFSHATAAANFTTTVTGVAVTTEKFGQSDFTFDTLDGNGPSGMIFDPTKGNVFQIDYQYLGFGEIRFLIEGPDGQFILFHEIQYSNQKVVPSLSNPSITLAIAAYNYAGGAGNSVFLKCESFALYTQGPRVLPRISYAKAVAKNSLGAARTPVMTIKQSQLYKGRLFLSESILRSLSVGVTNSKPVAVELVINGTLNNLANYSSIGGDSVMLVDTTATAITGGYVYAAFTLAKDGQTILDFLGASAGGGEKTIGRFDNVTVVVTPSAASTDVNVSLAWYEDL